MVTIKIWTIGAAKHWAGRDDSETVTANTNGEAFDKADRIGAVRIVDGYNHVYRKIAGEWIDLGEVS